MTNRLAMNTELVCPAGERCEEDAGNIGFCGVVEDAVSALGGFIGFVTDFLIRKIRYLGLDASKTHWQRNGRQRNEF